MPKIDLPPFPSRSAGIDRRRFLTLSGAALAAFASRKAQAQEVPIETPTLPDQATRDALPWHHASSLLDEPRYEEGFEHFAYVNPDAPKGGDARQGSFGAFDNFNPLLPQAETVDGLGYILETLMTPSLDEVDISAQYGLLAEALKYPQDYSWVSYRLNPDARWHDGEPVKPEDVIWSLAQWKELNPQYRYYYANVVEAQKTGDREVTFLFDVAGNRELPQIVGQLVILPQHWWEGQDANGQTRDISRTTLESILGSGPYRIGSHQAGRSITFQRVEDYWGRDLNVNVGSHNFDRLGFEYFRDETVQVQALKAGQYDFREENSATRWNTAYQEDIFPARRQGLVTLETVPETARGVMQAYVPNLRRAKFQDWRIRRALNLCYDFETLNRTVMYDSYERVDSYFAGTELASRGLPQGDELDLLEKYRDLVPETVFTEIYTNPVGGSPEAMRENLREAVRLFREAGYELQGRQMVNSQTGEPFTFEILYATEGSSRSILPYIETMNRIGLTVTPRLMETSAYIQRLNAFDYDMITFAWGQSLSPGNEQRNYWGSESAERPGSRNFAGIADPGVDALINELIFARTREELVASTHALDRVLLHHNYMVPQFFLSFNRYIIWNKFNHPDPFPEYSIGFPSVWWTDSGGAERIEAEEIDPGVTPETP